MKFIQVNILNCKKLLYTNNFVLSVHFRANDSGEIEVSYGHTQLLSTFSPCALLIKHREEKEIFSISEGIVEFNSNKMVFFVDFLKP